MQGMTAAQIWNLLCLLQRAERIGNLGTQTGSQRINDTYVLPSHRKVPSLLHQDNGFEDLTQVLPLSSAAPSLPHSSWLFPGHLMFVALGDGCSRVESQHQAWHILLTYPCFRGLCPQGEMPGIRLAPYTHPYLQFSMPSSLSLRKGERLGK